MIQQCSRHIFWVVSYRRPLHHSRWTVSSVSCSPSSSTASHLINSKGNGVNRFLHTSQFSMAKGNGGNHNNGGGRNNKGNVEQPEIVEASDTSKNANNTIGNVGGGSGSDVMKAGAGESAPRYPHLLALPIINRPFFPGLVQAFNIGSPKVFEASIHGLAY